jgi:SET domain-containing protein
MKAAGDFRPKETEYFLADRKEFLETEKKYLPFLLSGEPRGIEIRYIDGDTGFGLFAGRDIREGACLGEYTGIVSEPSRKTLFPRRRKERERTAYMWDYPPLRPGDGELEINALTGGSPLRFVNHSFCPCCAADHFAVSGRWIIFFRTVRPVEKGEELTVDYGEAYWSWPGRVLRC